MFPIDTTPCTGFYRDIILVSHVELFTIFAITGLLTFTFAYLGYELFILKKNPRFVYFFALGILGVVVVKTLIPLTGYYTEIPHYSQFDCTFNLLVYPSGYGPALDILFVYLRLLSLFILPLLFVMLIVKLLIKTYTTLRLYF